MKLAKTRKGISRFYFNQVFLESLRSGYLKRLDFDFCLYLTGFLNDVGLGYVAKLEMKRRNEMAKRSLFPALDLVKGQAMSHYELDGDGNIMFFHT